MAYLRCRIKEGAASGFVEIDSTYLDPNKLRFFKENTFSIKPIFTSGGINIIRGIQAAIDAGLTWLVGEQNPDGSWGASDQVGRTGFAVKKFEHYAVEHEKFPLDPTYQYYLQVKRGLDYIFSQADTTPISPQPAGNPDSDGDSIGVYFSSGDPHHRTYETGIALMAIAESKCPDSVVNVPGSPVNGWTYHDLAVDVVDYLAFGQNDTGDERGGWGYNENSVGWSDNSNSGYAVLGLAYAEAKPPYGFNIPVPTFVKNELSIWIDYIQCDQPGPGTDDGGSGYCNQYGTCYMVNTLKTGNLLSEMALRNELGGTRRDRAIAYLVRHWNDPDPDPGWQGSYQAMYCIMKGLEMQGLDTINGIDWYKDLSGSIVATQNPDSSWGPCDYGDNILCTEWALLTLEKVSPPPPQLDCERSFSDSGLVLCPLGDIPFNVFLRDSFNIPFVGYSNVWLDFSGCPGIIPCTTQTQWPLVYPAAPSDGSGKVTFHVSAGGCNQSCLVPVKAICGTIASVPVRSLDNSGNLYVGYSDFDSFYGLCRDYNFDDTVDYKDLSFFNEHKRHSCTTGPPDPCQFFRKYLIVDPDTNLPPGQITKVTLFVQNNSTIDCSIDSIKFYYSGFGALDTMKLFSSLIVGFNLSPGDSLKMGADYLWLDTTAVVFYARFYTDCCPTYIQVERSINRVRQCPPFGMDYKFGWYVGFSPVYTDTLPFMPSGWNYIIDYSVLSDSGVTIGTSSLSPLGTKGSLSLAAYRDPGRTDFVAERTFEVFVTLNSGDVNSDCIVNASDVVYLINYLFIHGPSPKPLRAADVNCDCRVTASDVVYLINYLFIGGPPPAPSDSCECQY